MNKKVTVLTLLAFSLATCAPTVYAANEPVQVQQDAPTDKSKLSVNRDMIAQIVGGTLIAVIIVVASVTVWKQFKHN